MQPQNGNAVAAERRLDLASLFCMIGRHGPAVALAAIALVSVLAGFIIYRTLRGKRRKARATAADGEGDGAEAERGASAIRPGPGPGPGPGAGPGPEESLGSAESTDLSNEDLSDIKDDADLFQSDLKIRHRRAAAAAAAEKKPPPHTPQSHIPRSDNTEAMTAERDSDKVAEASHDVRCDTCPEAEMEVACANDCHRSATEDTGGDVTEEVWDNRSCLKGNRLTEMEKVFKAEEQEYDRGNVDETSDEKEDENFQCSSHNQAHFNHSPPMTENTDRQQDDKTTPQSHSVESSWQEPITHVEDSAVTCTYYGKDEDFVEENHHVDSTDSSHFSPEEEEEKNEDEEAGVECVVQQQSLKQDATWSSISEQELNLPSPQQDQCDDVTDEATLPVGDNDRDGDGRLAGEAIEGDIEDHSRAAAEFAICPPRSDQQQPQIEQTTESSFTCNEEADREKTLTLDEDCDSSIVVLGSTLHCLSESAEVDYSVEDLSSVNSDTRETKSSGIGEFPDLPLDCQQPQREVKDDEIDPSLDKNTDVNPLDSELLEKEIQCQNNETGEFVVLAEETAEAFGKSSVSAGPDPTENRTASRQDEEMPQLPSICQDKKTERTEMNETFDDTVIVSATDADVCNNDKITTSAVFEEISHPDMWSFSQHQHNVPTRKDEDFSDFTTTSALATTDDFHPPTCPFHLPSFEPSELRDNDKDDTSSPGVGKESGISSMAVSPDLHGAGNEFDLTIDNMMLPAMDRRAQSEEAQYSLFGDDGAVPIINEDKEGAMVGPYPLSLSQQHPSEHTDSAKYESYAANEDIFGHDVENCYHRAMEKLMNQITASALILTKEDEEQTGVKTVLEVVEIKEKEGATVAKKTETEAEKEKQEDYEKTNISIMEATMDNNEWITDSNNQVLPWMNLSVQPLAQDHPKTEQLPPEDHQDSFSVTDATCKDTDTPPSTEVKQDTDAPPSVEVKQTSTLSLVDENTESSKKVVAVQPMPQNVNVTFRIHYVTHSPYQTLAVTGNQQELGNWKEFIPLERAKDGIWATVVSLPAESHVEWKFVVMDKGEAFRWEECSNRLLDTGYGDDLIVHKWWGFL